MVFAQQPSRGLYLRPIVVPDCPIRPLDDIEVPAEVPGLLAALNVKKFSVVKKGDIIAQLDDRLAKIDVESKRLTAENKAPVLQAVAALEERQAQFADEDKLYKRGNSAHEQWRLKKVQVEVATHQLDDVKAKQRLAEIDLKGAEERVASHVVRSQVDGVVVDIFKDAGEAVEARDKIVRVIRDSIVRVEGAIHVRDAEHLQRGMIVEVFPSKTLSARQHYHHTGPVNAVAVLPDGKRCVSAGDDGAIVVWNVAENRFEAEMRGHDGAIHCLATIPGDNDRIVSGGKDGTLRVWNLVERSNTVLAKLRNAIRSAVVDPARSNRVVTGDEDRKIRVWSLETGDEQKDCSPMSGHTNFVTSLAVTPDGKYLVSGGNDQTIRIWDLASGKEATSALKGRSSDVRQVGVSADGEFFLHNSFSVLQMRRVGDGSLAASIESLSGSFSDVAVFTPGGMVLTASDTRHLQLWQPAKGARPARLVRAYEGHTDPVQCVAVAPDGSYFVSAGADRSVRVWEIPTPDAIEREVKRGTVELHKSIDPRSQMLAVYAEIDNADRMLQPGRFATMVIYPVLPTTAVGN
jgi:WD40 repeat protein/biotin carboxyl carrier protein